MYRIVLIPLALLLVLVVILVPLIVGKETILDVAASALYKKTGATLTVAGDAKVTVFPLLGISLSEIAVDLPEREHYDLQARSVQIGVDLLPLLKGDIKIETIRLDGLVVRTESPAKQANSNMRQGDATVAYRCSLGKG
ncbi:MAG: AsmA family protein [Halioglobus sp.]